MEDYEADSPEPRRPGDAAAGDASAAPGVGARLPNAHPRPKRSPSLTPSLTPTLNPEPEPDPFPRAFTPRLTRWARSSPTCSSLC